MISSSNETRIALRCRTVNPYCTCDKHECNVPNAHNIINRFLILLLMPTLHRPDLPTLQSCRALRSLFEQVTSVDRQSLSCVVCATLLWMQCILNIARLSERSSFECVNVSQSLYSLYCVYRKVSALCSYLWNVIYKEGHLFIQSFKIVIYSFWVNKLNFCKVSSTACKFYCILICFICRLGY